MIVALIDNGSLEPAAHRNLRAVAAALTARTGVPVQAVSWKHSDRVPVAELDNIPASTVARWIRFHVAQGEREFVFVPFFIRAQGAIGSALRDDLERWQREFGGFSFTFTRGLAASGEVTVLAHIVADRARALIALRELRAPAVVVVDHGGPSPASATLRNEIAAAVFSELGTEIGLLAAASMEGGAHAHNHPLLADLLGAPGFNGGDIVVAPLFLSPGRHAGAHGDLSQIARAAECALAQRAGAAPVRAQLPVVGGASGMARTHGRDAIPFYTSRRATCQNMGETPMPPQTHGRDARATSELPARPTTGRCAEPVNEPEDPLASSALHCHFTELVGTHPLAAEALAAALRETLATLQAETLV